MVLFGDFFHSLIEDFHFVALGAEEPPEVCKRLIGRAVSLQENLERLRHGFKLTRLRLPHNRATIKHLLRGVVGVKNLEAIVLILDGTAPPRRRDVLGG